MSLKQAVTVIIYQDKKFLLGKRSRLKKVAPEYWCPISGGIEPGETEEMAVVREVFEEVGLEVLPQKKICEMKTHDGTTLLHWWTVKIVKGEAYLKNDEHSEIKWVDLEEMTELRPIFSEDLEIFRRCHFFDAPDEEN